MEKETTNTGFGLLSLAFLFFGDVLLFRQIVTLNPVNPSSIALVVCFIIFGLGSGIIAGTIVTQGELKVLKRKGEFTIGNRAIIYAGTAGILAFLLFHFLFRALSPAFVYGEVSFLFAGLFAYFLLRLILIVRWETENKRVVMIQQGTFSRSTRLYIYP